jgi:hypothetical protein
VQHQYSQLSEATGNARFDRPQGHLKDAGDFVVGVIFEVKQAHGGLELPLISLQVRQWGRGL